MSRKLRVFTLGYPYHVVQRGNNKIQIFLQKDDYFTFIDILLQGKKKYPVYIYGYCLMPNHFHLLVEPQTINSVSSLIQFLGAKYVRFFNNKYSRTGTLWEGRFKSVLVNTEQYLLTCLKYIEKNPVRANLVAKEEDYSWSSYRFHAFGQNNKILDQNFLYFDLGKTDEERQNRYKEFFQKSCSDDEISKIRP